MEQMPFLNCSGEDSTRSLFHRDGFVGCNFACSELAPDFPKLDMFDMRLSDDTIASEEMLSVLFQKARYPVIFHVIYLYII